VLVMVVQLGDALGCGARGLQSHGTALHGLALPDPAAGEQHRTQSGRLMHHNLRRLNVYWHVRFTWRPLCLLTPSASTVIYNVHCDELDGCKQLIILKASLSLVRLAVVTANDTHLSGNVNRSCLQNQGAFHKYYAEQDITCAS
jgi:hypothetical protein